jgi:hypothetical protein
MLHPCRIDFIVIRHHNVLISFFLGWIQLDLYTWFMKEHGGLQGGLACIWKIEVVLCQRQLKERNTCAYKYHVEMVKLKLGFNNMRMALWGVHGKHCVCNCDIFTNASSVLCMAEKCTFFGITNFWTSMLCPLDDVTCHQQLCLKGDCEDCDVIYVLHLAFRGGCKLNVTYAMEMLPKTFSW